MPSKLAKPHLLCLADTGGPTKYFKGNLKEKVDKATAAWAYQAHAKAFLEVHATARNFKDEPRLCNTPPRLPPPPHPPLPFLASIIIMY